MTASRQPLPTLAKIRALCTEARAACQKAMKADSFYSNLRWRRDRERLLIVGNAKGERLNNDYIAWNGTKAQIVELLARYPEAVEVEILGGIDAAENLEAMDCGNYEVEEWTTVIWRADRPVFTDEELDEIIRTNTAFRSMRELLSQPNYRPSLDCSQPALLAVADRYDAMQAARNDDRRAYRYRVPTAA